MVAYVKKPIQLIKMLFFRMFLTYRWKIWVAVLAPLILLISMGLFYRAVSTSYHSRQQQRRSMPAIAMRPNMNLQIKNNEPNEYEAYRVFKQDLMFADLIPMKIARATNKTSLATEHKEILLKYLKSLYPSDWEDARETDEVALELKYLLIDCGLESNMTCKDIDSMVITGPVLRSQSKYVDYAYKETEQTRGSTGSVRGNFNGQVSQQQRPNFVISSSFGDEDNMKTCLRQTRDVAVCAAKKGYRFLREVVFLNALQHPGILLLKGYCLRGNRVSAKLRKKGLIIVTEIGTPLSDSLLAASTWPQRVSIALQVAKLLLYLDSTPFGSLRFTKLTFSDFVLVRGTIVKLADFDDLELGSLPCKDDSQCKLLDIKKGGSCKKGLCYDLNQINNLHLATVNVIQPLLQHQEGYSELRFMPKLLSLEMSIKDLVEELQSVFNRNPPEGPVRFDWTGKTKRLHNQTGSDGEYQRNQEGSHSVQEVVTNSNILSNFIRKDHENFAGLYDYPCSGSQVAWGCVLTVSNLVIAANLCVNDDRCKCFVVFSSRPESEDLLTVVLKNGTDSKPLIFSGTTLFIRRQDAVVDGQLPDEQHQKADRNLIQANGQQQVKGVAMEVQSQDVQTCVDETLSNQASVRRSRERQLMNHLGLKGLKEHTWKKIALKYNVDEQDHVVRAEGKGGQFITNFTDSRLDNNEEVVRRIRFIAEDGPEVSHKATAVVYQLDRILGLYHTPPCIGRQLDADSVQKLRKNHEWYRSFKSIIESDGTLTGVLAVSASKPMKKMDRTLQPLQQMTMKIVPLDEAGRFQLEYILLVSLSRMEITKSSIGFNEHQILFGSDRAFTDLEVDMAGYLYHCQFPLDVYEILNCFRCGPQDRTTNARSHVCSLGEEVVRRAQAMFPEDTGQFLIHGMKDEDIIAEINEAATSVLRYVDACVKTFDTSVFY